MPDKDIEKIEPVDFDAASSPVFAPPPASSANGKPAPWMWVGLGVLALLALAVIFVLPAVVTEYELPLERRVDLTPSAPANNATNPRPAVNAVSPFTEAQRAIQRKEAQDVLAALLALQAELDALSVETWAESDYQQALDLAQGGDDAYLEQNFIGARESYQESLDALQRLKNNIPAMLNRYLIAGDSALQSGDAGVALESYSIAARLDPGNERARIGVARAGTLDEVTALLEQADEQRDAGQLEAARTTYTAALDLDSRNAVAQRRFEEVNQLILENRFAGVMSEGFNLLQADQPEQAIAAFQRAAALGINRDQAEAAIQQTRDAVARVAIERLRAEASTAEQNEQWEQAVSAFESILEIDPNLVFAQEGLDYVSKRLRLDQLLEGAIANPERLADDQVYQQTVDIYYTGRAIPDSGPRLLSQLDRLEGLLENSQIPVTVQFQSDNQTQVTLQRVATLGNFESQSLSLKPGRYVAIGVREGFRDVRQEFVVGFGQTPDTVVVKCEEPIVATRGR